MNFDKLKEKLNNDLKETSQKKLIMKNEINQLMQNKQNDYQMDIIVNAKNQLNEIFENIDDNSQTILSEISKISQMANVSLNNFQNLKYRKQNVEKILNTITSILELNRIYPILESHLKSQKFEEMIKYIKIYNNLQEYVDQNFCEEEFNKIQNFFIDLEKIAKINFEKAIFQNDKKQMNIFSAILGLLKTQENIFDKIQDFHSRKLQQEIDNQVFDFQSEDKYNFPYFNSFVKILEIFVQSIQNYQESIFTYYHGQGLLNIIQHQINNVIDQKIQQVFQQFVQYFENKQIQAQDLYCQEFAQISNQNENFQKYICQIFQDLQKDNIELQEFKIINTLQQSNMNVKILQIMDKYINIQQKFIRYSLQQILDTSLSLKKMVNFDKSFFMNFLEIKESLDSQSELFEFVDEIFILAQNCINRAISTLNKSIICAMQRCKIQQQKVLNVIQQLIMRYKRKEYFTQGNIEYSKNNSVYVLFLCCILNIVAIFPIYINKMRLSIIEEYDDWFQNDRSKMVLSSFDDFQTQNVMKFQNYSKEITQQFIELLSHKIQQDIELFFNSQFNLNSQNQNISNKLIQIFQTYLRQFKTHLSNESFEIFFNQFCQQLAQDLEKLVFKKKYNLMTPLILDMEIRRIISFLQEFSGLNIKSKFQKIKQILEILMQEDDNINYTLDQEELKQILSLKL